MSTWWSPPRRADIGTGGVASLLAAPTSLMNITNRGWYVLYRLLKSIGAKNLDTIARDNVFVPSHLLQAWSKTLAAIDPAEWSQWSYYNGSALVFGGVVHQSRLHEVPETAELTPFSITEAWLWLTVDIATQFSMASDGLVISGKPRKGSAMTVNLDKGGKVDLVKQAGGTLSKVMVGLGWDVRRGAGEAYDLDASVVGVGADGKCLSTDWFVFYNHKEAPNGAIVHQGDNLTGQGDGDDEKIDVDLDGLPAEVQKLVVAVTIHQARQRGNQSFTQVENAFMRVVDKSNGVELARYDLSEDTESGVNCLIFGELYRHDGTWKFKAVGDGFKDELQGLVNSYSIG